MLPLDKSALIQTPTLIDYGIRKEHVIESRVLLDSIAVNRVVPEELLDISHWNGKTARLVYVPASKDLYRIAFNESKLGWISRKIACLIPEHNTVDEILPMWALVDQIGTPHRENAKTPPHQEGHIRRLPTWSTTGASWCGVNYGSRCGPYRECPSLWLRYLGRTRVKSPWQDLPRWNPTRLEVEYVEKRKGI